MDQKLTYAVRDGRLVHIGEVGSGLNRDCLCPACGTALIARKGLRNRHHFAHYSKQECPYALESMLHYLAKNILAKESYIHLPPATLPRQQQPLFPTRRFYFDQVHLEKKVDQFIPDLILKKSSQQLLLEIKVTHSVQRSKLWRIRRAKLFSLEINAHALFQALTQPTLDFPLIAFQALLRDGLQHKAWLHHPAFQAATYRLKLQAAKKKIIQRHFPTYHLYAVGDCPRNKRFWRKGYGEGKAYAKVWQDCQHCPYCLEIEFSKRYIAYREVTESPQHVYCWGHLVDKPIS